MGHPVVTDHDRKNAMNIILQKGSPFIEAVNEKLYSLHELGFINTWINNLVANSSNCDTITKIVGSHGGGLQSLSLEQMQSFFYIVFSGLSLAALGFTIEFVKGNYCRVEKQTDDERMEVGREISKEIMSEIIRSR